MYKGSVFVCCIFVLTFGESDSKSVRSVLHWPTKKDGNGNDIGVQIPYAYGKGGNTTNIKKAMQEAIAVFKKS